MKSLQLLKSLHVSVLVYSFILFSVHIVFGKIQTFNCKILHDQHNEKDAFVTTQMGSNNRNDLKS